MKKTLVFPLLSVIMLCAFLMPQSAHALATIRLSDGTTTIDVGDGCTVDACGYLDSNPNEGVVTYIGGVGTDWWLNVSTGATYPTLGGAGSPQMDLSDMSMTSVGTSSLTILFSQDNYSHSQGQFTSSASVTTDGTASFNTYFDNGNALFAQTTSVGSLGAFIAVQPDESFRGMTTINGSTDSSYSITQEIIITHTAGGQNTSFNYSVTVVPEPISSTLFLIGGATLGFRRLRKRESRKARS